MKSSNLPAVGRKRNGTKNTKDEKYGVFNFELFNQIRFSVIQIYLYLCETLKET